MFISVFDPFSVKSDRLLEMAKANKSLNLLAFKMVGATGIEPVTPTMST
jgi:hypothetical protein